MNSVFSKISSKRSFSTSLLFATTAVLSTTFALSAFAAETPVNIDFAKQALSLEGVFKRPEGDRRNGLDIELEARREGIARLSQVLEKTCGGSPAWEAAMASDWQTTFRSQGSVIHPDHTLRLLLQSSLKNVFKNLPGGKPLALRDAGGKPFVLKVPVILLESSACGQMNLKLAGNTIPAKVFFAQASGLSDAQTVELKLDAPGIFVAKTPEGEALLTGSDISAQLAQLTGKTALLPAR